MGRSRSTLLPISLLVPFDFPTKILPLLPCFSGWAASQAAQSLTIPAERLSLSFGFHCAVSPATRLVWWGPRLRLAIMFSDRAILYVKGGDGGQGVVSFRKEKYVPRGGPDGGDGGHGGHVIIEAVEGLTNLAHLTHQRHWKAQRGGHGSGKTKHGASAPPLIIPVPPGTIVKDRDRNLVLRDLKRVGDWVVVARGGRGGRGNHYFKSATNRAPRIRELGKPGEERWLILELQVIADVGLLGLPNAGKSTLLSRVSRARPEIADYPFTTKYPNLGLVRLDHERAFVMADIPGLIEGAHAGHGLGHEFLRHVERTKLLVHLVEAAPLDGTDPVANYHLIRDEVARYSARLAERPELVVLTKLDAAPSDVLERFRAALGPDREVFGVSSVTGQGLPPLLNRIVERLNEVAADQDEPTAETEAALPVRFDPARIADLPPYDGPSQPPLNTMEPASLDQEEPIVPESPASPHADLATEPTAAGDPAR